MNKDSKIFISGHRGLVGSAILRLLKRKGYGNLIYRTSKELDLRNQEAVNTFFKNENIEYVFMAAAKVGGIIGNSNYPADFIYDNLMIEANIIKASKDNNINKLLFLGSACIYPKICEQPIKEDYLLSGYLEESNRPYAIAKIAGVELCKRYNEQYGTNFISLMPTNLYGPNDNFHPVNSHVFPALIRKFYEAKANNSNEIVIWGDGSPTREFLHVDDLADACLYTMLNYKSNDFINVGTSEEISIRVLAKKIKSISGYSGNLRFDKTKPNGTPRRKMDISKIEALGWKPKISLNEGIKSVYRWFEDNYSNIRS